MLLAFGLMLPVLAHPEPVHAIELWTLSEVRVPLTEHVPLLPRNLRLYNDYRYGDRYPGIGQALLRVGPLWELHPALQVASHLTTTIDQRSPGQYSQEVRAELEPTLRGRWGATAWTGRTRFEHRWLSTGARWRVRTQLRVAYHPPEQEWVPFVSEEGFWERGEFNQNRASLGVSHLFGRRARLDFGMLLRSRLDAGGGWVLDPVATVGWFFNPDIDPLLFDPSGD